jgi:predicted RecA/RadA family phage recombinase
MSKNFQQHGNVVTATAPSEVTSGDGVLIGSLFGVAEHDAANGDAVELGVVGVYRLPIDGAVTWGAPAYWTGSAVSASDGSGSNTLIGHFLCAQTGGTGAVRLAP